MEKCGPSSARDYYPQREVLWQAVSQSLDELRQQADLVVMEGAGSPAELNLMASDIVNLAVARYASAPCLLVGDIDRGGIFAQLLGTYGLLDEADRKLLKGLIVNKFRGDLSMFQSGVDLLEGRSGLPVLGVVPYLHNHGIADEDAAGLSEHAVSGDGRLDLAVIWLPHISNFDDVDPLWFEPDVRVRFVRRVEELGQPRAILLPGTKSTLSDLAWLHDTGLARAIGARHARGASVVGVCGGYQMLGAEVSDPQRVELSQERLPGLNLLATRTVFSSKKQSPAAGLKSWAGTASGARSAGRLSKATKFTWVRPTPTRRCSISCPEKGRLFRPSTAPAAPTARCLAPTCTAGLKMTPSGVPGLKAWARSRPGKRLPIIAPWPTIAWPMSLRHRLTWDAWTALSSRGCGLEPGLRPFQRQSSACSPGPRVKRGYTGRCGPQFHRSFR